MWECFAGDCLPITLALLDSNEDPVDLTGYGFTIDVVWGQTERDCALFDIDSQGRNKITLTSLNIDEALGTIETSLTGAQTEQLAGGKKNKVYLRITEPSASCIKSVLLGKIRVRP